MDGDVRRFEQPVRHHIPESTAGTPFATEAIVEARRLASELEKENITALGVTPRACAAGIVYVASGRWGNELTQARVGEFFDVSTMTIRKAYSTIFPVWKMPLQHYHRVSEVRIDIGGDD